MITNLLIRFRLKKRAKIKMKQKPSTPKPKACSCGKRPIVEDDLFERGGSGFMFRVYCKGCGENLSKWCKSPHRAICRHNNRV